MSPELLIIAALAVYRLTLLFSREAGPGDIFGRLRARMGVRYDEHSQPYGSNWLSEGILCPLCTSVWVGIGVTLFVLVTHWLNLDSAALYILLPFALSGISVFLFRWVGT